MRTTVFLSVFLLWSSIFFATNSYQPLNVSTGLWQVTATNNLGGAPHSSTYKTCVTAKDLNTNPWANGPDEKCDWTVVSSTASDMEVQGTSCQAGKEYGMQTSVDIKLHAVDTQNVKASMDGTATGNGQTMKFNGTYTGKWLNSSCPASTD